MLVPKLSAQAQITLVLYFSSPDQPRSTYLRNSVHESKSATQNETPLLSKSNIGLRQLLSSEVFVVSQFPTVSSLLSRISIVKKFNLVIIFALSSHVGLKIKIELNMTS